MDRKLELESNLHDVQTQIRKACEAADRDYSDVTLIVVTKTWPTSDVNLLAELGVTDVGENRDQEAKPKHDEVLADNLTWHAIGQLQTNKAKSVATWADVVHSVDRPDLVSALAKAVANRNSNLNRESARATELGALIQVDLDPSPQDNRGGVSPDQALELAKLVSSTPGLYLKGVMGVAPLGGNDDQAFALLQQVAKQIQQFDSSATWISAGMSADFATALKYGATHLRIGSSILGKRAFKG
jgi:pyridoxal phosphate enzyme (YggS family)